MSNHQPGDILRLEKFFYVYELLDDHGLVFYVGVSSDPPYRFRSHANPKHCDRQVICDAILEQQNPVMRIVSVHETREAAMAAETVRIRLIPGLLNEVGFGKDRHKHLAKRARKRQRRKERCQNGLKSHISGDGVAPPLTRALSPQAPVAEWTVGVPSHGGSAGWVSDDPCAYERESSGIT